MLNHCKDVLHRTVKALALGSSIRVIGTDEDAGATGNRTISFPALTRTRSSIPTLGSIMKVVDVLEMKNRWKQVPKTGGGKLAPGPGGVQ